MERMDRFIKRMSPSLAQELLDGAKIIHHYMPKDDKGIIVLERAKPVMENVAENPRAFWFAAYYLNDDCGWYCGTEYIKMRRKSVIQEAHRD